MRVLLALVLVAAALHVAPTGAACHPSFGFWTPTDPSVGVSNSSSCDHKRTTTCAWIEGSDLQPVSRCATVLP